MDTRFSKLGKDKEKNKFFESLDKTIIQDLKTEITDYLQKKCSHQTTTCFFEFTNKIEPDINRTLVRTYGWKVPVSSELYRDFDKKQILDYLILRLDSLRKEIIQQIDSDKADNTLIFRDGLETDSYFDMQTYDLTYVFLIRYAKIPSKYLDN